MKISLMIEASPDTLAKILAALPSDGSATVTAPAGATIVGNGMPSGPQPIPPMPTGSTGEDDEEDEGDPISANIPADGVDKDGLPWDERIHASTKGKNKDGSWKKRKNVDDATYTAVVAELRARPVAQPTPQPMPTPQPVPTPQPMPQPVTQPMPQPVTQPVVIASPQPQPVPMPTPQPQPMPQPVPQTVAAAPAIVDGMDFQTFMQHVGNLTARRDANGAPFVGPEYLAGLTQRVSVGYQLTTPLSVITDLAMPQNAHMVKYAAELMQHDGKW